MDSDIEFALRIQANENGIFDEEIIQQLIEECHKKDTLDVNELVENMFDIGTDDDFQYSVAGNEYISCIELLRKHMQRIECELINETSQRTLRQRLNANQVALPANPNIISQIASQLDQEIFGNGQWFDPGYASQYVPRRAYFPQSTGRFPRRLIRSDYSQPFEMPIGTFGENVPVTLTEEALNKIEDLKYENIVEKFPNLPNDEKCAICQDDLKNDSDNHLYNVLSCCDNIFHSDCVKQIFKDYDHHCPICRKSCGEHIAKFDAVSDEIDDDELSDVD